MFILDPDSDAIYTPFLFWSHEEIRWAVHRVYSGTMLRCHMYTIFILEPSGDQVVCTPCLFWTQAQMLYIHRFYSGAMRRSDRLYNVFNLEPC